MRLFGLDIQLARKTATEMDINTFIARLTAAYETLSGVAVTPESCMQSPTVAAIVSGISRRIATLPIKVMQKTTEKEGNARRVRTEELPRHPVAILLRSPNGWQDNVSFWLDATSWLVRYGNCYFFKSRGSTGPIRQLIPLHPSAVKIDQDSSSYALSYTVSQAGGGQATYSADQILHARSAARDGVKGDSPITDIREAIALEIAAEKMGASLFGNAAAPSLIFKHGVNSNGFKTDEEEKKFIDDFQSIYAKKGRFKSMILPKGMELDSIGIDNEKAQFLATRQYQRTVIAGAFGFPLHMVGDLSRGTYNNVEQTSLDFITNGVLPYVRIFEAALEASLLTQDDRNSSVIIRFDLNAALRGDFFSRQQGLAVQRQNGIINANEWREEEGRNPVAPEDGGEEYWRKGPSGQSASTDQQPQQPPAQSDQPTQDTQQGGANGRAS